MEQLIVMAGNTVDKFQDLQDKFGSDKSHVTENLHRLKAGRGALIWRGVSDCSDWLDKDPSVSMAVSGTGSKPKVNIRLLHLIFEKMRGVHIYFSCASSGSSKHSRTDSRFCRARLPHSQQVKFLPQWTKDPLWTLYSFRMNCWMFVHSLSFCTTFSWNLLYRAGFTISSNF